MNAKIDKSTALLGVAPVELTVGQLGAKIPIEHAGHSALATNARLDEIERRILKLEGDK